MTAVPDTAPSWKNVLLTHWLPPIITGAVGLVTGATLSFFQQTAATDKYFLEHRVAVAEGVANEFSSYVHNWNRLRVRNTNLREKVLSGVVLSEDDRKELLAIAAERSKARDALYAHFNKLNLYFRDEVVERVTKFREWDTTYDAARLEQLPAIKEWETWKTNILRAIGKELQQ
jgi:hypothetical protein